jgi:hypothetical protein
LPDRPEEAVHQLANLLRWKLEDARGLVRALLRLLAAISAWCDNEAAGEGNLTGQHIEFLGLQEWDYIPN